MRERRIERLLSIVSRSKMKRGEKDTMSLPEWRCTARCRASCAAPSRLCRRRAAARRSRSRSPKPLSHDLHIPPARLHASFFLLPNERECQSGVEWLNFRGPQRSRIQKINIAMTQMRTRAVFLGARSENRDNNQLFLSLLIAPARRRRRQLRPIGKIKIEKKNIKIKKNLI